REESRRTGGPHPRSAHGGRLGHRAARTGLPRRELGGDARRDGTVHPAASHAVGDLRRSGAGTHGKGAARLMADITMPQLGETVTEGTITKWMKKVGDQVAEDEVLFEVSTDKVDSEVPSPAAGYVAEILVQEGETVDVGVKLAVISDAPAGNGGAPAPAATSAPAAAPAA